MTPKPNASKTAAPSTSRTTAPGSQGNFRHDKTKKPPHQTFYIRDAGSYEATDDPDYGSPFQVNVVYRIQAEPGHDADFSQLMILDTACQRTCCGTAWEESHDRWLREHRLRPHHISCSDAFQFGRGDPLKAARRTYIPAGIGGTNMIFGAGVVDAKVPLLASNKLLDQLGMILDLPRDLVSFEKLSVTVPLHRVSGHLAVCITDFNARPTWKELQQRVNWDAPPAELVAQDTEETSFETRASFDARCDLAPSPASCMAARLAAGGEQAADLPAAGLREPGHGGEPRPPSGRDLRVDSPGAGRDLQPPPGHLRPSGVHPLRQRLREVRQVQEVPPPTSLEREQGRLGGPSRQKVRHFTAHFATALALLIQYCVGGGALQQQSVPAFSPDLLTGSLGETFNQEALGAQGIGEQCVGDGIGPLEATSGRGRGVGNLRLDRGRLKRLQGAWTQSARTLGTERHLYDQAPSTASRPPPNVDVLTVFPGADTLQTGLAKFHLTSATASATRPLPLLPRLLPRRHHGP